MQCNSRMSLARCVHFGGGVSDPQGALDVPQCPENRSSTTMLHNFKFAFRSLLKSPGFVVVSVVTLALGIGLNTSMFTMLNVFVLKPLAYPDRDHLVRVYRTTPQIQQGAHSAPDYLELARTNEALTSMAA